MIYLLAIGMFACIALTVFSMFAGGLGLMLASKAAGLGFVAVCVGWAFACAIDAAEGRR